MSIATATTTAIRTAANKWRMRAVRAAVGATLATGFLPFVAAAASATPSTSIVISEFRFAGPGGAADEFVEIYNGSTAAVDISGWLLRGSNSTGFVSTRATVPASTLVAPHHYYLFANSSTQYSGPAPDLAYATGITSDGGVAVVMPGPTGTIVDQVGLSPGSAFKEGSPISDLAADSQSYERKPGGSRGHGPDTDDNSADFTLIDTPTPTPSSARPVPSNATIDFDGNGATDIAVFRISGGTWYVRGAADEATAFGAGNDIPVPGDYDGDSITDFAIYRPATGLWAIHSSRTDENSFTTYGISTDQPVASDYDGDGITDIAVYRPSVGTWYVHRSSDGDDDLTTFGGIPADLAIPGDYDGDGTADLAIFRPAASTWYIHGTSGGDVSVAYGTHGDVPVPADYDGDAATDIAIYRPSTGLWAIRGVGGSNSFTTYGGIPKDAPVPGDYDGDGKADIAIRRPQSGGWFVHNSHTNTDFAVTYGIPNDVAVAVPPTLRIT